MRIPKKITWEFLFKYAYGKRQIDDGILFYQHDNYWLGFNRFGQMKLYQHTNWSEKIIILRKNMPYEDMFDVMQQLKRSLKDKYYILKKHKICNCENPKLKVRKIK